MAKQVNSVTMSCLRRVRLTDFFGHGQALRVDDGGEFLLLQLLDGVLVVSEVQLGAHQDDGSVGAVVSDLRVPLRGGRGGSGSDGSVLDEKPLEETLLREGA